MKHLLAALTLLATAAAAEAAESPLPGEELGEMASGRLRLERVVGQSAGAPAPAAIARAEASFACWTAGLEEMAADDRFPSCRDEFLLALAQLEQTGAVARASLAAGQ